MDPLTLEATFTDDMMDNNYKVAEELQKIAKFMTAMIGRYLIAEKGQCGHPVLVNIYNSTSQLDAAVATLNGPPRVQLPGMMMSPPAKGRMN